MEEMGKLTKILHITICVAIDRLLTFTVRISFVPSLPSWLTNRGAFTEDLQNEQPLLRGDFADAQSALSEHLHVLQSTLVSSKASQLSECQHLVELLDELHWKDVSTGIAGLDSDP